MEILQKTKNATQWMIDIANNNSHGYSQSVRWGPSYDCSSLVIQAWEMAGVPVKSQGATYTGNMYEIFLSNGFVDVTNQIQLSSGNGLEYGDICLNYSSHVVAYIGNGQIVHARSSEGTNDTIDSSGNEIRVQNYWNFPWNCVLRYKEKEQTDYEEKQTSTEELVQENNIEASIKKDDVVKIIGDTYYNGILIPSWVKNHNWIVYSVNEDKVVINKAVDSQISIMSPINIADIQKVESNINYKVQENQSTESKSYTVVRGDSLWKIAKNLLGDGTRYLEIKQLNNLESDIIYAGQILKLP